MFLRLHLYLTGNQMLGKERCLNWMGLIFLEIAFLSPLTRTISRQLVYARYIRKKKNNKYCTEGGIQAIYRLRSSELLHWCWFWQKAAPLLSEEPGQAASVSRQTPIHQMPANEHHNHWLSPGTTGATRDPHCTVPAALSHLHSGVLNINSFFITGRYLHFFTSTCLSWKVFWSRTITCHRFVQLPRQQGGF